MNRIFRWMPEVLIAALAVALRAPGLGRAPLSVTEARVWLFTADNWQHLWRLFQIQADRDTGSLFTYIAALKFWSGFGSGEAWLRLPSLLAGLAALVFVYLFARQIFGRAAGCVAALMMAVSPYHIMTCRMAGANAIGFLFFVIVLYLFARVFEGENRGWTALSFAVAAIAGVNYGFHTALLILPMNVLYLGFGRERVRGLWWWIPLNAALIGSVMYWLPRWSATFFIPSSNFAVNEIFPKEIMANDTFLMLRTRMILVEKYIQIIYGLGGAYFYQRLADGWSVLGAVLLPVVYHYLPFIGLREYEGGYRPRVFGFIMIALLIAAAAGLSLTTLPLWETLLPCSVVFYALAANGAVRFSGWRAKTLLALMFFCVVFGFVRSERLEERSRPDWRRAASEIAADPSGAPAAFLDGSISPPLFYYGQNIRNRIFALTPNIDMKPIGNGLYCQDEVLPVLKFTVDPYPPDGIAKLFIPGGSALPGGMIFVQPVQPPEVWVIRVGAEYPENPRWAREYAIWLNGYAVKIKEESITPAIRIGSKRKRSVPGDDRLLVPEEDRIFLQKWALKEGFQFVPEKAN